MKALIASWKFWSQSSFLSEVTLGGKLLSTASVCGELSETHCHFPEFPAVKSDKMWVHWAHIGGGCACVLWELDHQVWRLTSCHGCCANWQKGFGWCPWSSTKAFCSFCSKQSDIILFSADMFRKHAGVNMLHVFSFLFHLPNFWHFTIYNLNDEGSVKGGIKGASTKCLIVSSSGLQWPWSGI